MAIISETKALEKVHIRTERETSIEEVMKAELVKIRVRVIGDEKGRWKAWVAEAKWDAEVKWARWAAWVAEVEWDAEVKWARWAAWAAEVKCVRWVKGARWAVWAAEVKCVRWVKWTVWVV